MVQMIRTRDQDYAITIFGQITAFGAESKEEQLRYGSLAHKLPILIRTAGLAQALAFVAASKSKAADQILTDLAATIGLDSKQTLLAQSRGTEQSSLQDYLLLTQQTLRALLWYKRFAQSILKVVDSRAAEPTAVGGA